MTGFTNGQPIPNGTLIPDISGNTTSAYPATVSVSGVSICYETNVLGAHSSIRFSGQSKSQLILPIALVLGNNNFSFIMISREVYPDKGPGTINPTAYFVPGVNALVYGQGTSVNMDQDVIQQPFGSTQTYFNQIVAPSSWAIHGVATGNPTSYCFLNNQQQGVTGVFANITPTPEAGGFINSQSTSGEYSANEDTEILIFDHAITQIINNQPEYFALQQWARQYYGINIDAPSILDGFYGDSTIGSYSGTGNSAGNPGLSMENVFQSLVPKSHQVINMGISGAGGVSLITDIPAFNNLLLGNKYSITNAWIQDSYNDISGASGAAQSAATIESYLTTLYTQARQAGWIRVYGFTAWPAGYSPTPESVRVSLNTWIKTTAIQTGLLDGFVDSGANAAITQSGYAAPHPGNNGYVAFGYQAAATAMTAPYLSTPVSVAGSAGYFLWTDNIYSNQSKTFMYTLNGYTGGSPVTVTLPIPFSITPSAGELVSGVATSCSTTQFIVPIVVSPASGTGTFNSNQ